jgi:hypothetical protein
VAAHAAAETGAAGNHLVEQQALGRCGARQQVSGSAVEIGARQHLSMMRFDRNIGYADANAGRRRTSQ